MSDVTSDIFGDLVSGLEQIDRHVGGADAGITFHVPEKLDVAAIRARSGHSQPVFASSIGVKVATLKQWEQGRRSPQGPARVLLAMIAREPRVVARVLTRPAPSEAEQAPPTGARSSAKAKRRGALAG